MFRKRKRVFGKRMIMLKNIIETACCLYGVVLIILSIYGWFLYSRKKKSCNYKIKAKLVGTKRERHSNPFVSMDRMLSDTYPIFEYIYNGKLYKGTSINVFLSSKAYKIGEMYTIYINPKKPKECCLKRFKNRIGK